MNKPAANEITSSPAQGLHEFFAAAEARVDRWRSLHRLTKALAAPGRADAEKQRTRRSPRSTSSRRSRPCADIPGRA